jgi:hypothetical protein
VSLFIAQPLLAALLGAAFLGLGWWSGSRAAGLAGALWLVYWGYETGMQQRWLCSGECNIRVDLLLIYPVLLVASLVGLVGAGRAGARRQGQRP